jgi:hypothetical protein
MQEALIAEFFVFRKRIINLIDYEKIMKNIIFKKIKIKNSKNNLKKC